MKLLASNVRELLDMSEAYFRSGLGRCVTEGGNCVYLRNDNHRCVIGNILFFESDYERYWTRNYKGSCDGLLYGMFDLSPLTHLVQAALALQALHDNADNWLGNGFVAWDKFNKIKEDFT